jgi:DNA-binding NtrC family response regulator
MLGEDFNWQGTLQEVTARAIERIERFRIDAALRAAKWNKTRAAEQLGVSYKTLLHKIRALGLEE